MNISGGVDSATFSIKSQNKCGWRHRKLAWTPKARFRFRHHYVSLSDSKLSYKGKNATVTLVVTKLSLDKQGRFGRSTAGQRQK